MSIMGTMETFHPRMVKKILEFNKPLAKRKFPEPKKPPKSNGGAKRIAPRWVKTIICVIGRLTNTKWRQLPAKLADCHFLVYDGYMDRIPKKSTFNDTWNEIDKSQMRSWVRQLGRSMAFTQDDDALASDSSGVEMINGSIWRYVNYSEEKLKKQSTLFKKNHMTISLPSRAIVATHFTESKASDYTMFGKTWKLLSKRLIKQVDRFYLDKGYWGETITGLIDQAEIKPVIPMKSNSVDHGTERAIDLLVRAQKNYPGLYRCNHQLQRRAAVENVFGLLKLEDLEIHDKKENNKIKTLLAQMIHYNINLYLEEPIEL